VREIVTGTTVFASRARSEQAGTNDELMATVGHYAELFELQAAAYR
jgi:hypothetical protein